MNKVFKILIHSKFNALTTIPRVGSPPFPFAKGWNDRAGLVEGGQNRGRIWFIFGFGPNSGHMKSGSA